MVKVLRANINDAERIAQCTRDAYSLEIKTYHDKSKVNEYPDTIDVRHDITNLEYYKIMLQDMIIGGFYIVRKSEEAAEIEDFCISPEFQNKGYGSFCLNEIERLHPEITTWEMVTPTYSLGNQYLYEKLGYKKDKIAMYDDIMSVYYKKVCCT